jgi:hypothetical protein
VDNLLVVQPGTSVFTALADLINSREKVYCDAMKHQQFGEKQLIITALP